MSRAFAGLFALSLLAATPAFAAEGREMHRTVSLEAGGSVSIRTFKGSIDVEPWDQPRAEVFARIEPDTSCGAVPQQQERVRLTEVDAQTSRPETRRLHPRGRGRHEERVQPAAVFSAVCAEHHWTSRVADGSRLFQDRA